MSWPLVFVKTLPNRPERLDGQPFRVGDCYFAPWLLVDRKVSLGAKYLEKHEATRAPIYIVRPNLDHWCPDQRAWTTGQGYHGDGWDVSGDLPRITCAPSINVVGCYHGWVQNGVITDDCEGRRFDADGKRLP